MDGGERGIGNPDAPSEEFGKSKKRKMSNSNNRPLVPDNIDSLTPYEAGKTIAEVREAYQPSRISKLASNENRLGCSPRVEEAVLEALEEIQDYPDPVSRKLREELAERNDVDPENIIVAAGSESIISILCRTFFLDGEEAITAEATFVGFFVQANIRGITLRQVPMDEEYGFDLERMAEAITPATKMIYVANPNNPTGTYVSKDEFERFMERVPDDLLVIMDEAYFEFAEEVGDYPHSLDYGYPNVLTLRTFSKAYGLAGFRVGYAMGPRRLINEMMKTKLTFEPTAPAQAAARAALKDREFLEKTKTMVAESRSRLYDFFDREGIRYVPSVSNSVLMLLPDAEQAGAFTQAMMEEGVILRRTHAFGLPEGIRITVGRREEMEHFEESFQKVVRGIEIQ